MAKIGEYKLGQFVEVDLGYGPHTHDVKAKIVEISRGRALWTNEECDIIVVQYAGERITTNL
jgi:hypothetical protein